MRMRSLVALAGLLLGLSMVMLTSGSALANDDATTSNETTNATGTLRVGSLLTGITGKVTETVDTVLTNTLGEGTGTPITDVTQPVSGLVEELGTTVDELIDTTVAPTTSPIIGTPESENTILEIGATTRDLLGDTGNEGLPLGTVLDPVVTTVDDLVTDVLDTGTAPINDLATTVDDVVAGVLGTETTPVSDIVETVTGALDAPLGDTGVDLCVLNVGAGANLSGIRPNTDTSAGVTTPCDTDGAGILDLGVGTDLVGGIVSGLTGDGDTPVGNLLDPVVGTVDGLLGGDGATPVGDLLNPIIGVVDNLLTDTVGEGNLSLCILGLGVDGTVSELQPGTDAALSVDLSCGDGDGADDGNDDGDGDDDGDGNDDGDGDDNDDGAGDGDGNNDDDGNGGHDDGSGNDDGDGDGDTGNGNNDDNGDNDDADNGNGDNDDNGDGGTGDDDNGDTGDGAGDGSNDSDNGDNDDAGDGDGGSDGDGTNSDGDDDAGAGNEPGPSNPLDPGTVGGGVGIGIGTTGPQAAAVAGQSTDFGTIMPQTGQPGAVIAPAAASDALLFLLAMLASLILIGGVALRRLSMA